MKVVIDVPGPDEGVWAVYAFDVGPYLIALYGTEIDALRELNNVGYGAVVFVRWGQGLGEAIAAEKAS